VLRTTGPGTALSTATRTPFTKPIDEGETMRGLFLLLVVLAALAGASFAGARFTAGRLTGPHPAGLGSPTTRFAFKGIPALRSKPRGWVVAYPDAREFGRGGAEIYVSPTGRLLGTRPTDLARRLLEASRRDEP
jgi:hypothetical protein